ncbi:MAG: hypothetical protein ACLSE8_14385 [Parasutterella sp.]
MENPALFSSIVSAPGVCFREVKHTVLFVYPVVEEVIKDGKVWHRRWHERMINALELRSRRLRELL